ncbi:acylamino-acid-releasing enzyme [Chanos chanos]|uniref:Acylamino-acid-releasing enzyme n=1 Tax=Chanos chanos TaxID=29144 RepID=A0A6J2W977_CHACN|nr:acylamino-acid-releasing enzyme-like [Chanos chanos]
MQSEITEVFGQLNHFPSPLAASVSVYPEATTGSVNKHISVSTEWNQCESGRAARLRFSQHWTLQCDRGTVLQILPSGPCMHTQGELLSSHSASGELRAVVRETSGSGAGRQYLEVWGKHGLVKSLDLTSLNRHGKVYEDAQFACLDWSPCEQKLLYVAERKRPKVEPSGDSASMASNDGSETKTTDKDRSVYVEDWGEGLVGKSTSVLCVADLRKGEVTVLEGPPLQVSPGQGLWAPDGRGVVFVSWWHEPFRLGLKFCSNRRSALFYLDLTGNCEPLSSDCVSVLCPRFSPDGRWLVYLQGRVFGPHRQCLSLWLYNWENRTTSVLVDVVRRAERGEFAGLYDSLPTRCWSSDSQRVVFSTVRENWREIYTVDKDTGRVTRLSNSVEFGSWKLLTIDQNLMVASCSSPNRPSSLVVGFLPGNCEAEGVVWSPLGDSGSSIDLDWTTLEVTPGSEEENAQFSGLHFGALLLKPCRSALNKKFPVVVFIHGGPHSTFSAEWNVTAAALIKLGFAVLMVNYRGSTGYGQDSIESLIGNIGSQDVKDVQRAVLHALQTDTTLDPERVVVMGGSHGGFLACHLIGQYPKFYRACAARNPVINAATLLGTSDIVDWRYSSIGLQYNYSQLPTADALSIMLQRSPIAHAAQICAPVLLMLGGKDKRVSPYQGLELYKALKSRESPVRLLWFAEDGHSLSKVSTQVNCFLNIALWFQEHLNMT